MRTIDRDTYLSMQVEIVSTLMIRNPTFDAHTLAGEAMNIVDAVLLFNGTDVEPPSAEKKPNRTGSKKIPSKKAKKA